MRPETLVQAKAGVNLWVFRKSRNRAFDVGSDGLYCVIPERPAAADD
jgi:hypothetical protein